jgi:hypothetical protein
MDHFEAAVEKRMVEIILERDAAKVEAEARRRLAEADEEERRLEEAIRTDDIDTIKEMAGVRKKVVGMPSWVGGSVYGTVASKARTYLVQLRIARARSAATNTCEELPSYMTQSHFTAAEVADLTDVALLSAFVRITGHKHLYCAHCRKDTLVEDNWSEVIRKRCEKKGLHSDLPLPKTCDVMSARNDMCNPVNNRYYPKLRTSVKRKDVTVLSAMRASEIEELGLDSRPYKYCP